MQTLRGVVGILVVWGIAASAWIALGSLTGSRSARQKEHLRHQVNELWGKAQTQRAPALKLRYEPLPSTPAGQATAQADQAAQTDKGVAPTREPEGPEATSNASAESTLMAASLTSSDIAVRLRSDPRRKGLVWYALYDVDFRAEYSYVHDQDRPALLQIEFKLPIADAVYDNLTFSVDGEDQSKNLDPASGALTHQLRVLPKQRVTFGASYRSRGADTWRYAPAEGVARLTAFHLALSTDFEAIDFPPESLSPSKRSTQGGGWDLEWRFRQMVTGQDIGMAMPSHIQPGELASALSFSAPVSLMFFFVVLFVFGTLRRLDVHPINYLLLAAAFFAFHLLFAYTADQIPVVPAFVIASVVSLVLVTSYLRLVVSSTFAFREAGIAQLVYLVGFSLAHFWEGFTGLTITVLAVLTLFLMMQLTGRIRWREVLHGRNDRRIRGPNEVAPH